MSPSAVSTPGVGVIAMSPRDTLGALRGVLRGWQQEALPDLDRPARSARARVPGDPAVVAAELPQQGARGMSRTGRLTTRPIAPLASCRTM